MPWVFWLKGEGFVQMLVCKTVFFARILTFENGLGCPGSILGWLN
jgi:8-amino-7-oxononanoate synthase